MLRLGLALALLAIPPAVAAAQDDPADDAAAEDEAAEEGDAPAFDDEIEGDDVDPRTVEGAPEELPDDADLGPPLSERPPVLSEEEQRRLRARNFDPSEPEHPVAVQIFLGIAAALDSSLDRALRAHWYGDSPVIVLGDIAVLGRLTEWLYVGGRLGGNGRGWSSNLESAAMGGGIDAMAVAYARAYLGRVVDIGAMLGAGLGWGGISVSRGGAADAAPRVHGSAILAFRVDSGVRLCTRFAWDWFAIYDIDRYGSDLELGGPSLSIGLEVRR